MLGSGEGFETALSSFGDIELSLTLPRGLAGCGVWPDLSSTSPSRRNFWRMWTLQGRLWGALEALLQHTVVLSQQSVADSGTADGPGDLKPTSFLLAENGLHNPGNSYLHLYGSGW